MTLFRKRVQSHKKLAYRQIYRQVSGDDEIGFSPRMVSNLVSRLRSKLKASDDTPELIHSIRGASYQFGG